MSRSTPSPSAARTHLRADGISISFAGRRVLTDVSFVVSAGDRTGLIGENGSGKSTLLRILAGFAPADSGTVRAFAPGGVSPRIGLLHQEPPFSPSDTVAGALETAIAPVRAAAAAVDRAAQAMAGAAEGPASDAAAAAYSSALDEAERLGVWDVDARVGAVLDGVGLTALTGERARDRSTAELSGGQRARLSLAWVLLNAPDILLMDEPTNHLDDEAVAYLARMLAAWRGPVLFASHDRAFLDEAATSLLDLDPAPKPHADTEELVQDGAGSGIGIARFAGGYSDYLAERAVERRRWEEQYRAEQDELARLRAAVEGSQQVGHAEWKPRTEQRGAQKFYADRNSRVVSRRVNDARSRLEVLEAGQIRRPPTELAFAGLTAAGLPKGSGAPERDREPLLSVASLEIVGRLSRVDLEVGDGARILVTGPNGAGKSTLLQAVAGRIEPSVGRVERRRRTTVGLLEQETVLADPRGRGGARSALEAYVDGVGAQRAERVPLSTFGLLAARDEGHPVGSLSVGQRRRLGLAILLADPPSLLLLDEPTNHLSLALAEELEAAIASYPGAVLVASHDRRLREKWEGETLSLSAWRE